MTIRPRRARGATLLAVTALPLSLLVAAPTATVAAPASATGASSVVGTAQQGAATAQLQPAARKAKKAKQQAKKAKQQAKKQKNKANKPKTAAQKAKQAQKEARQAATEARKAAQALTAADKKVKRLLAKALRLRAKAQKSGDRKARQRNNAAWKQVKAAKKAKTKATKQVTKTEAKAEQKQTVAEKRTAQAASVTSVTADALPPISQPGAAPAPADQAANVVSVRVTPAIPYVPVTIEAQTSQGWQAVAQTQTGDKGVAEVRVPRHAAYRAVAKGKASAADSAPTRLDFSDEFNRGALGDGWVHRMSKHHPDGMRACSKGDPRATSLNGQALQLWVLRDPDRTDRCKTLRKGVYEGPYSYRLNGHVSTEKAYSFQYGTAAARMKFQSATHGQHASFWLQPVSSTGRGITPDQAGAEIDVVEWFGRKNRSSGMTQFTYHTEASGELVKSGDILTDLERFLSSKDDDWFTHYHVFSVEWTPTEYIFRIDGKESFRSSAGISHRPQFLILSLLSSDYEIAAAGDAGEAQLGTQKAEVDWVRVWK